MEFRISGLSPIPAIWLGFIARGLVHAFCTLYGLFRGHFFVVMRMFSLKALLDQSSQGSGSQRSLALTSAAAPLFWSPPPEALLSQQVFLGTAPLERLVETERDCIKSFQCMQHDRQTDIGHVCRQISGRIRFFVWCGNARNLHSRHSGMKLLHLGGLGRLHS